MPRFTFVRWFAIALCAALGTPELSAQDAVQIAKDATAERAAIQKKLAAGKDVADKDMPALHRLRLDGFSAEKKDDPVKVTGVFLDTGVKPKLETDVWSPTFTAVKAEAEKLILAQIKNKDEEVKFDWTGVARVGAVDGKGQPQNKLVPPHVLVQEAANKAGGQKDAARRNPAADRVALTGSRFGEDGELILVGLREDNPDVEKWLSANVETVLKGHPAAGKDGKPVGWKSVKPTEWTVGSPALQKLLATSEDKLLHRLFVSRAYFVLDPMSTDPDDRWSSLVFQVEGIQVGKGGVIEKLPRAVIEPVVKKLLPSAQASCTALVEGVLAEPVKDLQLAVTRSESLDGVRVDPGFTFGPGGELLIAGIQPGLDVAGGKDLEAVIQSALVAYSKGMLTDEKAEKYTILAARPVSVKGMTALPIGKVLEDLRTWVADPKDEKGKAVKLDDVKASRLYFPADKDGSLILEYQVADKEDGIKVEAEFQRLIKVHLPGGTNAGPPAAAPAPEGTGGPAPAAILKQPLLPGLTTFLRAEMSRDQQKWYGVLIERGKFDKKNRYTLAGVVDSKEQNDELAKLLDQLKDDPKWAAYFSPPANPPVLNVIPMGEMLDRVKRVTPAYPTFDGIRIIEAKYDKDSNLVFDAHTAGPIDREAAVLLAKLLRDHPTYRRRAPTDKQVRIVRATGPAYSDDQVANFSLAFGAKLLAKADAGPADKAKAKVWLDVALLHYPNEAAVWFLSAQYNYLYGDENKDRRLEVVRRDLYRMIDLEGPLAFNGPAQRKRRYEAAKDFQGTARNELEALWLECFREVKDGATPITLASGK